MKLHWWSLLRNGGNHSLSNHSSHLFSNRSLLPSLERCEFAFVYSFCCFENCKAKCIIPRTYGDSFFFFIFSHSEFHFTNSCLSTFLIARLNNSQSILCSNCTNLAQYFLIVSLYYLFPLNNIRKYKNYQSITIEFYVSEKDTSKYFFRTWLDLFL